MYDYKDHCKEYEDEPCDIVSRQPPACFKPSKGKKTPLLNFQCSDGLSKAVFTKEYGILSLRTPEGWLLWHSSNLDGITLADLLNEAGENLKKLLKQVNKRR